jgi:hypothetical protein
MQTTFQLQRLYLAAGEAYNLADKLRRPGFILLKCVSESPESSFIRN